MPEPPQAIRLSAVPWAVDEEGIRDRALIVGGARWAIVEYGEGVEREDWCQEGHHGLVLSGEIEYSFEDDRPPFRVSAGDAFFLPSGIGHRGRNRASGPTTMFVLDDPA